MRRLLLALVAIHAVGAAYLAKDFLLPVALGFLLALTLSPVVRALARFGAPEPVSATVLIAILAAGGFAATYGAGDTIAGLADRAPNFGAELKLRLAKLTRSVEAVKDATETVEDIADGATSSNEVRTVVVNRPGLLASAISGFASAGTSAIVGMILALFMLASGSALQETVIAYFAEETRERRRLAAVVEDIERLISRYLFTITIINACLGVAVAAAFHLIGMPAPLLWGLATFLLNFMPYVGTAIGVCLSAAVAIVTFDTLQYAALAPLAYLVLGSLEGQLATPAVVGRRLEINVVLVFLTVLFWTWLWGVAGALIAVPMLVIAKAVISHEATAEEVRGEQPA